VKQNDIEVASFDMNISVKDSDYSFTIKSLDLKSPFTSLGLKKWLPNQGVQAGRLTINKSELRLAPKGNGHFKGNIKFNGFTLPSDKRNSKPTLLDSSFIIDAGVTNKVFGIKRFTANLPRSAKAEKNVGTISGHIDLSNLRAPSGRIQLKSDALDITPVVAFLKPAKIQTEKQAAVKPASTLGQQQVTTNRFSFQQFKIGLDLKRLHWRDLVATNIVGRVELNDRKYTFSPVQMHLMGEPAKIEGYVVAASGSNTQYDLNIKRMHWRDLFATDINGSVEINDKKYKYDLNIKRMHWRDLNATEVIGEVQLDGPIYNVKQLNAKVGGGTVLCKINIDRSLDNKASFWVKVSNVNLGQLNLGGQADFNGTVDGTINASTHGSSWLELVKHISGEAGIVMKTPSLAAVTAINLAIPQTGLIKQITQLIPTLFTNIEKLPSKVTSLVLKLSDLRIDQIELSKSTWEASDGVLSLEGLVQVEEGKHWYDINGTMELGYSHPDTPIKYNIDGHWPSEVLRTKSVPIISGFKALDSILNAASKTLNAANKTIDVKNFYSIGGTFGKPIRKLNAENLLKALAVETLPFDLSLPFDLFK
jgi:hypothetical protein